MIDILEFLRPNASSAELTLLSNICVYVGWILTFLGFLGTVLLIFDEKSFIFDERKVSFAEVVQLIYFGLFMIVYLGMHSTVSFSSFFYYNSIFISIP